MREYRLVYSSPCGADGLRKTGYIYGRIHVRVPPISAQTGKAMLHPFSDGPANRARLAGVCRVDVLHGDTSTLGLVCNKVLQLPKGPTMQASANALACPDAITDMRQVFHADFSHVQSVRFLNDGLGYFVVDVIEICSCTQAKAFLPWMALPDSWIGKKVRVTLIDGPESNGPESNDAPDADEAPQHYADIRGV